MPVTLYGAAYSVYVRIARLALEEKGVPYTLEEIDIFAEDGPPADYLERQPFSRIPAFDHDGFGLHETGAITRYVDEAFDGPALMPQDLRERARANQIISIADNHAYSSLVWGIYTEAVADVRSGEQKDVEAINSAVQRARQCLAVIAGLKGTGTWLASDRLSLADLYLASMVSYLLAANEGQDVWADVPGLHAWWNTIIERPSMKATRSNDMAG